MGRPKRFTATQPDTDNSSTNSHESRPKRFKITPLTENSNASSRDSRPKHSKVTPPDACTRSPAKSGACSRPPTQVHDYTYSSDSRPKHSKVTPPGACSSSPAKSGAPPGACSRSPAKSGACSRPPTQVPDYTYSSDSSDDDDDDDDEVIRTTETITKRSKKKSYWIVGLIDEDGAITEGRLKVRDIWSLPTGKKVIIPCNELGQPIDDAGGLLGGFLGDLGSDYAKFPMCYKSWRKVPINYKNVVYDDIIQKKFLVEDERLKDDIMKSIGKKWKDTRCRLYHRFYNDLLTLEENVARRPSGIDPNQWMWFLQYRKDKKTQKMSKQNAENRQMQQYTHTNGSKSIPRRKHEEELKLGRPLSRGELWILTHKDKDKDNSYMNEAAKLVGEEIERIESQDGISKKISKHDSLARVLGKEHPGRVRGVGYGPCPTQVFGQTANQFSGVSSTQASRDRNVEEMKLKMQKLEALVESERSRRQALESFLARYLVQQGMELPAELADMFRLQGKEVDQFHRGLEHLPNHDVEGHYNT